MKIVQLEVVNNGRTTTREVFVPADKILQIIPQDYEQAEPFLVYVEGRGGHSPLQCIGHHDDLLADLKDA